jgi:hypothetical protein
LCYGNENCITNKSDGQKLEATPIRFLRPSSGLTKLDPQRDLDIHNTLKVNSLTENIKLYKKSWLDSLKRMNRSRLHKVAFQYQSWKTQEKMKHSGTS